MAKRSKESIAKYKATMAAKKAAKQAEGSSFFPPEIPLSAIPHGMKKKGIRKMPPVSKKEEIALELARLFNKLL